MTVEVLETLPAGLPEHSLGDGVVVWMERWLRSPADPRLPLLLTSEQVRFLLWWYAVDSSGRFLFRRGVLRRPKGWGKDPLCACICLVELLGPVRFDSWDEESGIPRGRPAVQAFVQVAGVSEAQTRTTTTLLAPLVSDELEALHHVDISDRRVKARVGEHIVELRPITKSARSAEGARPTAFVSNETQHWIASNGGHAMSKVIRRNLAKLPEGAARELAITNAHEPGEESIAERDNDAWRKQQESGGGDILLDNREPILDEEFSLEDDDSLREALSAAYGDSYWVDLNRLIAECRDPDTTESDAHRFFLNRLVAGVHKWMAPSDLDLARRDWAIPAAGQAVSVGFDGSRTQDSTAIVCTDMRTGFQWVAGAWECDLGADSWEVPEDEVREVVRRIFDTWEVARMYADPAWWEDDVWQWCGRWPGRVAAWWMTGSTRTKTARAVTAYHGALIRQECTWGGSAHDRYRRHLLNAVARPLQGHLDDGRLHTLSKPSRHSTQFVDIAVAGMLSWQARGDAIAAGWTPPVPLRALSRSQAERRLKEQESDLTEVR